LRFLTLIVFYVSKAFLKTIKFFYFFYFKLIFFLVFSDHFDALISKIIFKKLKKKYFDAFPSEKHFEKQPQPHSQTCSDPVCFCVLRTLLKKIKKF
jgi:hypothetical protein